MKTIKNTRFDIRTRKSSFSDTRNQGGKNHIDVVVIFSRLILKHDVRVKKKICEMKCVAEIHVKHNGIRLILINIKR